MASNKQFLAAVALLIAVVALLILGVRLFREDYSEYTYNNFPFKKEGKLWVTWAEKTGQPYKIPFYYHPSELEYVVAQPGTEQTLLRAARDNPNATVYITLDPELESKAVVAAVEISRLTGDRYNLLNLRTVGALTRTPEEQLAATQNPIVTCEDAGNESIVIWLTLGSVSIISEQDGCIVLEGTDVEDLLRVADRFAYMIIGVMN